MRLGVSPTASIPTGVFSQSFGGFISLRWSPELGGLSRSPVVPPGLSARECGTSWSSSCCLACPGPPVPPSCPSLPLLLAWMNVSSLTPWLSNFHTIQFSVSSDWFLFLNLLVSLLCLCVRRHSISTYTSILARSQAIFS